jgi:hypothetical protein
MVSIYLVDTDLSGLAVYFTDRTSRFANYVKYDGVIFDRNSFKTSIRFYCPFTVTE